MKLQKEYEILIHSLKKYAYSSLLNFIRHTISDKREVKKMIQFLNSPELGELNSVQLRKLKKVLLDFINVQLSFQEGKISNEIEILNLSKWFFSKAYILEADNSLKKVQATKSCETNICSYFNYIFYKNRISILEGKRVNVSRQINFFTSLFLYELYSSFSNLSLLNHDLIILDTDKNETCLPTELIKFCEASNSDYGKLIVFRINALKYLRQQDFGNLIQVQEKSIQLFESSDELKKWHDQDYFFLLHDMIYFKLFSEDIDDSFDAYVSKFSLINLQHYNRQYIYVDLFYRRLIISLSLLSNKKSEAINTICLSMDNAFNTGNNYFQFSILQLKIIYCIIYGFIKEAKSASVLSLSLMNKNPELSIGEKLVFRILMFILYFECKDFIYLSTAIEALRKYCFRNKINKGIIKEVMSFFEKTVFVTNKTTLSEMAKYHKSKLVSAYSEAFIHSSIGFFYLLWLDSKIEMTTNEIIIINKWKLATTLSESFNSSPRNSLNY